MSGAEMAGAVALGIGFGVLGYVVPVMGVLLTIVIVLVVLAALLGDTGALGGAILSPFAALWRWLRREGEGAWLRRAPVIGLVGGGLVRWGQNLAVAQGGA
jgi:hypothetical protein